jgi:hypothetical protein
MLWPDMIGHAVIPAHGRLRQEDWEFKEWAILHNETHIVYIVI